MTLTYISCSSDFYTFYVNVPLSLGCMIRKISAEDIAIRGNGTGLEYMCPTRHFVYIFFNPVFQVSTAKNEINLFNNHVLIVAPVTFAPAGAMTPSAEFLCKKWESQPKSRSPTPPKQESHFFFMTILFHCFSVKFSTSPLPPTPHPPKKLLLSVLSDHECYGCLLKTYFNQNQLKLS